MDGAGGHVRAWRFHGFGDMRLHELPDPERGPHDALARARVVEPSVTRRCSRSAAETFGIEVMSARTCARPPAALFGHESCAEVLEVAAKVTGLQPARGWRTSRRSLAWPAALPRGP